MGISDIKNYYYYTTYKSWAKVKHQYSDNRTETKTYSIDMEGELNYKLYPGIECNSGNITLNSIEIRDTDYNEIISVSDTVLSVKNFSRVLVVTYNQFTDARLLNEYHAFYDDNLISFEFPCITYGEAKVDFNVREVASDESWTTYIFQGRLDVQFGDAWHYNLLEFLINVKN